MASSRIKLKDTIKICNFAFGSSETTKQVKINSTGGNVFIWFFGKSSGNFATSQCYGIIRLNPDNNICEVYNATNNTISGSYNGSTKVLTITANNNANITLVSYWIMSV